MNIDEDLSKEKLKNILKFDEEKYKEHINFYLTSGKSSKNNSEIINQCFNF